MQDRSLLMSADGVFVTTPQQRLILERYFLYPDFHTFTVPYGINLGDLTPKSESENLKSENQQLKKDIEKLHSENRELKDLNNQSEQSKRKAHTEEEAFLLLCSKTIIVFIMPT